MFSGWVFRASPRHAPPRSESRRRSQLDPALPTRQSSERVGADEQHERTIGADLSLGDHRALTGELAQLTQEHPLRERLAGQYMVALYRSGRQAEALRAYRHLRETLVEQLGIDPNPTLVRLEQAILEQRQDLDWSPIEAETLPPAQPSRLTVSQSGATVAARGREAAAAARWQEAVDLLLVADRDGTLTGADLEALAEALLWTGHPLESLTAP